MGSFGVVQVPQVAVRKSGVAVTGAPGALYTVSGGRILLWGCYGVVTTAVGAAATSIRLDANPTTGADTPLCGQAAITSAAVGSLFGLTGTLSDALQVQSGSQGALMSMTTPLIIAPGTIDLIVAAGGTTGVVDWYALFDALDTGASLVAA